MNAAPVFSAFQIERCSTALQLEVRHAIDALQRSVFLC